MRRTRAAGSGSFVTAAALMVVLVLVTQLPALAAPRAAARGTLAPLEALATGAGSLVAGAAAGFTDAGRLRSDNERLAAENGRLRGRLASLQAAGQENDELRRALDFQRGYGQRTLTAQVIGRGPDAFTRSLSIDRGSSSGVRSGMIVVTGFGLVGRVREVAPGWASVQTVGDPTLRVNAYAVGSNLEGTVSGGPGPLEMAVIPRPGVAGDAGAWVLTSGIGGGYPRGIAVGRIIQFQHRDSATAQRAELAWANDLQAVTAVLVLTGFEPR